MKRLKKKDLLFLATKLSEKILDPGNAKEHYQSFIRKKTKKSVKRSKIVDIKSVTTVHPKTSHKLSKCIRQAEKVRSHSSLYNDTKKVKLF